MKNVLTNLFFLLILTVSAKANHFPECSGSGACNITSMPVGAVRGDSLIIAPGTYASASTWDVFSGVTVIGTGVTFTNTISINNISANYFKNFTFSNNTGDVFLLTGIIDSLQFDSCTYLGCTGTIFDGSGYNVTYNGTTASLKVYKLTIKNSYFHNSGVILQGTYANPPSLTNFMDSVSMYNIHVDSPNNNGVMVNDYALFRLWVNNWNCTSTTQSNTEDGGMFVLYGNAIISNVKIHDYYGYLARIWELSLGARKDTYVFNCLKLSGLAYGFIDTRIDTTMTNASPQIQGGNVHVLNNVLGNAVDINGYVTPIVIWSGSPGDSIEIKNNLAFNNPQHGTNTITNNNGSTAINPDDTTNNLYFSAAQAVYALQDTLNCVPTSTSSLNGGGVTPFSPVLNTVTYNNVAEPPYPVGANSYTSSSTLTPPTLTPASSATVDNSFIVTFTPTPSWNSAITSITINGTTVSSSAYSLGSGTITFTPANSVLLQTNGTKSIIVYATGYYNNPVSQPLGVGAAHSLSISTQPVASNTTNPATLSVQPIVKILDQYGNLTASTATVTATIGSGASWSLTGTTAISAVSGVATWANLGTSNTLTTFNTVTITFTSSGLTSATSNNLNLVPVTPPGCGCVVWLFGYKRNFVTI
jgi:hypothetical protein